MLHASDPAARIAELLSLVAVQVRSPSRRTAVWLGLTMLVLPFAHFFTMLLTFGAAYRGGVIDCPTACVLPADGGAGACL